MTSPSNAVLLGIDCGGSHTAVVVGDKQGRILARAEGPGSAMRPGGAERSAAVILDVARRAATQAHATLPATVALIGAAGAGLDFDEAVVWVHRVAEHAAELERRDVVGVAEPELQGEEARQRRLGGPVAYDRIAAADHERTGATTHEVAQLLEAHAPCLLLLDELLAYLTTRLLFPADAAMRLTIPTLVAFHPMITEITAVVSVDGLLILCYSLLIYLSLRVLRDGFTWPIGLLMGLVFIVGLLTKPTINGYAPLIALLVVYDGWRKKTTKVVTTNGTTPGRGGRSRRL